MLAALPAVGPLPGLPQLPLPVGINSALTNATERANVPLTELRQLHIRDLLHVHRAVLEADPSGEPIVRHEVLAFSPTDIALANAMEAGFSIVRERDLEGLDARIVVLRAPPKLSTPRALLKLRALDPEGDYDFNHLYTDSGDVEPDPGRAGENSPNAAAMPSGALKIGIVDGGVDATHPVFENVVIHQHGCGEKPVPSPHGTAVASLIAGRAEKFQGAAPGAELFVADIYCNRPTGGAMDDIADGIAWIARQRVAVINVSLVGPRNILLEKVIHIVSARGYLVVAAVGNDGPAAPPLYPASYPEVVGVTAVDAREHVLLEAGRGRQVDFAAPGADMAAAVMAHAYAPVRGTSFATPIVASLIAAQLREPNKTEAEQAVADLVRQAIDLGARGPDEIYGNGLVGGALRVDPGLAGPIGNK